MVNAPSTRRGASSLGCLASVVVLMGVLYYGVNLGEIWWRYFELKDRMTTAARHATTPQTTTEQMLHDLRNDVADIGLPAEAKAFRIQKTDQPPTIRIETDYYEQVDLPLLHRRLHFHPKVFFKQ